MKIKPLIPIIFLILMPLFFSGASATPLTERQQRSIEFVRSVSSEAIAILSNPEIPPPAREQALRSLFIRYLDLEAIAPKSIGKNWHSLAPKEQSAYLKLFSRYLTLKLSRQLGAYSGQSLDISGALPSGRSSTLVQAEIHQIDSPPIKTEWRISDQAQTCKILDLVVEGISMLQTLKADFSSVIRNQGINGLMTALEKQIARMEALS